MTTYTSTTQHQRDLLDAVALCAVLGPDGALAALIEFGVIDANHHIDSPEYKQALQEASE